MKFQFVASLAATNSKNSKKTSSSNRLHIGIVVLALRGLPGALATTGLLPGLGAGLPGGLAGGLAGLTGFPSIPTPAPVAQLDLTIVIFYIFQRILVDWRIGAKSGCLGAWEILIRRV